MLSKSALTDRIAELRSAGLSIGYADPCKAYQYGRLSCHDISRYEFEGAMPFVEMDAVKDECRYGQSSAYEESNFRSLKRDFGAAVVEVGYMNVSTLGVFVHSVDDDMISRIIGLKIDYPIYDESDWSERETERITESWEWLSRDLYSDLPDALQDLYFEHGEDSVRDGFWELLSGTDYYPEASGWEVVWDMDKARDLFTTAIRNAQRARLGRPALAVA